MDLGGKASARNASPETDRRTHQRTGRERTRRQPMECAGRDLAALPVLFDDKFAHFQEQRIRLQRFMNQSTNLVAIEAAVKQLEDEIEAHRKEAMLASDAPEAPPIYPRHELSPCRQSLPRRWRTRRCRSACKFRQNASRLSTDEFPPELQKRLRGLTKANEIISEIHEFHIKEVNRKAQEAACPTRGDSTRTTTAPTSCAPGISSTRMAKGNAGSAPQAP